MAKIVGVGLLLGMYGMAGVDREMSPCGVGQEVA